MKNIGKMCKKISHEKKREKMAKKVLKEKLEIRKNISRNEKIFSHCFQWDEKNIKIKIMTEKCEKCRKSRRIKKWGKNL